MQVCLNQSSRELFLKMKSNQSALRIVHLHIVPAFWEDVLQFSNKLLSTIFRRWMLYDVLLFVFPPTSLPMWVNPWRKTARLMSQWLWELTLKAQHTSHRCWFWIGGPSTYRIVSSTDDALLPVARMLWFNSQGFRMVAARSVSSAILGLSQLENSM